MADDTAPYRCLVIVQLGDSSMERLARDCPAIIDVFRRFSKGEMEQVFRSSDGALFGYFLKVNSPLAFIKAEFEKSGATTNADSILLTEIGEKFHGSGFVRAWTWLQHH